MTHPRFSIVIPSKDRPQSLLRCLESLRSLEYGQWEAIVVNDGGTATFSALDERIVEQLPLVLLEMAPRGPAAARNKGASMAQGNLLAFTDDDCVVKPDWLLRLAEGFEQTGADALGGRSLNPYPDNLASTTWHLATC